MQSGDGMQPGRRLFREHQELKVSLKTLIKNYRGMSSNAPSRVFVPSKDDCRDEWFN